MTRIRRLAAKGYSGPALLLLLACAAGTGLLPAREAKAATLQLTISDNADDDTWLPQHGFWFSSVGQAATLAQGLDSEGTAYQIALRFQSVSIPQGASITSATLELAVGATDGSVDFGVLYGNDADDAPAWGGATTPDNMTRTTASSALLGSDVIDSVHTIDVTDIVQEIVDRTGWASGNDIAFGGDASNNDSIAYTAFDGGGAITLDIVYGEEGGEEEEEPPAREIRLKGNIRLQGIRLF